MYIRTWPLYLNNTFQLNILDEVYDIRYELFINNYGIKQKKYYN